MHLPAAFLINRPKDFVNHVMQRYINAEAIHPEDITEEEPGFFRVKKQSHEEGDSKEFYSVRLGGENELPSSECRDWQRNFMPCKHFCAIFMSKPAWR